MNRLLTQRKLENLTVTNSYIEHITSSMPKDKANAAQIAAFAQRLARVIGVVALVISGFVVLLKLALYTFGLVYLQKPHIRALFQVGFRPHLTSVL